MRCVGVRALKKKLGEYLRLVARGESFLVTDRDRVVAELMPPREARGALGSDAILADAVRKGWISPAAVSPGAPPPRLPVDSLAKILRELDAERGER